MTDTHQFATDRILDYLEANGPQTTYDLQKGAGLFKSTLQNALHQLRKLQCVDCKHVGAKQYLWTMLKRPDRDGRPKSHAPVLAPVYRKPRPLSKSGTGIITPPRALPEFKTLARRDFYLAMELAEMTR